MIEIHSEIVNINLSDGLKIGEMNFSNAAKRKEMNQVLPKPSSSAKSRNVFHQIPKNSCQFNKKLKSTTGLKISGKVMNSNTAIVN